MNFKDKVYAGVLNISLFMCGTHLINFKNFNFKNLPNLVETGREEGEVCGVPGQVVAHPRLAW